MTSPLPQRIPLVIDTDPGIDDAFAILLAFKSPEVEVVGMTTIFGNVSTSVSTSNAIHLRELAGRTDVPVAEGASHRLDQEGEVRVAHFVHGEDGLGNTNPKPPEGNPVGIGAAEFIVGMAGKYKGQLNLLMLGPLTNLAEAVRLDPSVKDKIALVVVLGGAIQTNGNVNPAAEANIFGDPPAADLVFSSGLDIRLVGLDATHLCVMPEADLQELRDSGGEYGAYLHGISQFYIDFHEKVWGARMMVAHDAVAMVAVLRPDLFNWRTGAVCVATEGIAKGQTIMDFGGKMWLSPTPWSDRLPAEVALGCNAPEVLAIIKGRLSQV